MAAAILTHVIIAFSSIIYTTYLFVRPSKAKFYVSYGLISATLLSGTYLVWSTHTHMLQACVSGLAYLGLVLAGLVAARYRLATAAKITDRTKKLDQQGDA